MAGGKLQAAARGLYYAQVASKFGPAPAADEELLRAAIDRDKVRVEARDLDGMGLRVGLDRGADLLPDDAVPELMAAYVDLRDALADEATQLMGNGALT
jgi:hypothetical protein